VHRCSSLGTRLAHQTSLPKVDAPSTTGTRPPLPCAEKNPYPTRPPHALRAPVPDVRGDHHRGGSPGDYRTLSQPRSGDCRPVRTWIGYGVSLYYRTGRTQHLTPIGKASHDRGCDPSQEEVWRTNPLAHSIVTPTVMYPPPEPAPIEKPA
jgi:hypothetical protein